MMLNIEEQMKNFTKMKENNLTKMPKNKRTVKNVPVRTKNLGGIYVFKIILDNSTPRIWRRILVSKDCSFFDLHCAIQNAIGWTDSHLHSFILNSIGNWRINIQFPDPENNFGTLGIDFKDERQEKIATYFDVIKQCVYTYDFGDNWHHTILLEKEIEKDVLRKYPQCIGGKNACPPDDCGGVHGYERLIKIIGNPRDKEHKDMVKWLCLDKADDFDPSEFNPADIKFEDTKKRLKEYEKGFGVKSLQLIK